MFLAAALLGSVAAQPAEVNLSWLEGCWETEAGTRERWMAEGPKHLFGWNAVYRNGSVGFFEQLRLEERDGRWTFYAYPRGVGPTPFALTEADRQSATFDNPDHDFPQRLRYRRDGDQLMAFAETIDGGRSERWAYARRGRATSD